MFCKLFETQKYGQLLLVLDKDEEQDDYPALTLSFQPPNLGVCNVKMSFDPNKDEDMCWNLAEKTLAEFTEEQAILLVKKPFEAFVEFSHFELPDSDSSMTVTSFKQSEEDYAVTLVNKEGERVDLLLPKSAFGYEELDEPYGLNLVVLGEHYE